MMVWLVWKSFFWFSLGVAISGIIKKDFASIIEFTFPISVFCLALTLVGWGR